MCGNAWECVGMSEHLQERVRMCRESLGMRGMCTNEWESMAMWRLRRNAWERVRMRANVRECVGIREHA